MVLSHSHLYDVVVIHFLFSKTYPEKFSNGIKEAIN